MPHKNKPRFITPLEVQDILDNCHGSDCHLALMQCIAKGINDLLHGRARERTVVYGPKNKAKDSDSFIGECKT